MALQYKIDAETHEGLDDVVRGLYVEKDGGFVLDLTGAEGDDDIAGLRKALKEERQSAREAQHDLKALRKRLDGRGGDDDDHSEEKTAEIETMRAEFEKQLAERDEKIAKLESESGKKDRAKRISDAVAKHGGDFDLLEPMLDRKVAENPDLDLDEMMPEIRKNHPAAFKSAGADQTGTGGNPGQESGGHRARIRTEGLQRSKMSDRQKIDFQKEHGLDAFLALPE